MTTNRLTRTDDRPTAVHHERRLFDVEGMHCASCLSRVERALLTVDGVSEAHANLAMNQVSVIVDPRRVTPAGIQLAVAQAGYRAQPAAAPEQAADRMVARELAEVAFWRRRFVVSLALLIPLWLAHRYWPSSLAAFSGWIQLLLATPLQVYVGGPYFRSAWQRLRYLSTNMDTLIALGTGTAYVAGVVGVFSNASMLTFHDAAMILTFITLGKYLEAKAKGRASHAIRQLLELTPPHATLLVDGQIQQVAATQVDVGQLILVRPGEKIPLDARVTAGNSDVNQAWLTGESIPVDKTSGDVIYAGTINGGGALQAVVIHASGQTTLAQTIELVRTAQESKSDVQRLADRVVSWFVPGVLVLAVLTLAGWLALGEPRTALTCMVSVLIVACPCALGLATPTAILVGGGRGAERGILVKDAQSLEQAGRIDTVLLDKTGTITLGQPRVVHLLPSRGTDERQLLATAAAAEKLSGHPLAHAVVAAAESQGIATDHADALEIVPGQGIACRRRGAPVVVGTEQLLASRAVDLGPLDRAAVERGRGQGQTALLVAENNRLLGTILVADPPAPHSAEAVAGLQRVPLEVIMLSGDKRATAEAIARQVGISRVFAEVHPADKQRIVENLQREGHAVAMVGDGINDAPALVAADLGIAVGTGADVAIESADIVLVQQDLRKVLEAIRLARATLRTIRQNLAWAFVYNVTLLPLAAGLIVPVAGPGVLHLLPALSAGAMALSSVSVVANSLYLRYRTL
jgi:Cu+-exporting ATPase